MLITLAGAALFFSLVPQLPAPIVEPEEKATPAAEEPATPKRKHSVKPKTGDGASSTKNVARPATTTALPRPKFAGTWSGTVNVPNPLVGGNSQCTYIINSAETSVHESCQRFRENTSAATAHGNSITWKNGFFKEYTNVLTLIGNGQTGEVTITSSWGNGAGTVRKAN